MSFTDLTIRELHQKMVSKELSAVELTDYYLDRIHTLNPELNAFITTTYEIARGRAQQVDRAVSSGEKLPLLAGIPASIKDVIVTKGILSTGASQILRNHIPPYNATVVEKLDDVQYVLVGKNNCDEFAMGTSNENSSFGPVKNPWDTSRVSGGTSGGSAAAVAAGLSHYSIGTDTGGSVRLPGSFCGVVAFKPTYGRVSRYGLMAMASSFDQAGILARRVDDIRDVLSAIEGHDPLDATSQTYTDNNLGSRIKPLESLNGIRVGVPQEYFAEGLDPHVEHVTRDALRQLEGLGAHIIEVSLPHSQYGLAAYYILVPAEVSSNIAKYDGVRYGVSYIDNSTLPIASLEQLYNTNRSAGLGDEVKRRVMLGSFVLSAGYHDQYYKRAQKVRQLVRQDFERAFEQVDVIVGPVAPVPAFALGEKANDPLALYLMDIYTVTVNLAGLPALSVPAGFTQNKLPVGLHMIGTWGDDYRLLDISRVFEEHSQHYKIKPDFSK